MEARVEALPVRSPFRKATMAHMEVVALLEARPVHSPFRRATTAITVWSDRRPVHSQLPSARSTMAIRVQAMEQLGVQPVPSRSHSPPIMDTTVEPLRAVRPVPSRSRCSRVTDMVIRGPAVRRVRNPLRNPSSKGTDTDTVRSAREVMPEHTRSPARRRTTEAITDRADRTSSITTDCLRTAKASECGSAPTSPRMGP